MRAIMMMGVGAAALALGACGGSDQEEQAAAGADQSATAASTTVATTGAAGGASGTPTLRPGLWRVVTTDPGGGTSTNETCVHPQGDATKPLTGLEGNTNCADVKVTREGDAWVTRATCSADAAAGAGGTVESRTTGDFQSRYSVDMVMRAAAAPGQEMRIRMDATRVGDC